MRVLQLHCPYVTPGGEEVVIETEAKLLREAGHEVRQLRFPNADITRLQAFARQIFSRYASGKIGEEILSFKPDVVAVHNLTWALGPSALLAAHACRVPVVASIHNERLLFGWHDVRRKPYNDSWSQSVALALGNTIHRQTWLRCVNVFAPVSNYVATGLRHAGFDRHAAIIVKHNGPAMTPVPGDGRGGYALFVGRLVREKGVEVLLQAWTQTGSMLPLKIVGDGPLGLSIECDGPSGVEWLGPRSHDDVLELMGHAKVVVVPSIWQDPFPNVAVEALSVGTPTIVSKVGGLPETRPTMLVPPGKPGELAASVRRIAMMPESEYVHLRVEAREHYLQSFAPERQLKKLLQIYEAAIRHRSTARKPWNRLRDPATDAHLARLDSHE